MRLYRDSVSWTASGKKKFLRKWAGIRRVHFITPKTEELLRGPIVKAKDFSCYDSAGLYERLGSKHGGLLPREVCCNKRINTSIQMVPCRFGRPQIDFLGLHDK